MADLLATIALDRSDAAAERALDGLRVAHEALRGAAGGEETVAAPGVRACLLRRTAAPSAGVAKRDKAWTAWAGSLAAGAGDMAAPLPELDGQFALVRAEADGETTTVATDPLGLKPLFAASSGRVAYFSTSALVLARHLRAAPSRLGFETFLRTGNQFGRATHWEGIQRLQPAELVRFTGMARLAQSYWQPQPEAGIAGLSLAELADLCIERASVALTADYRGTRPWLDLTGGFDSRLLALLARRAGIEFEANTAGEAGEEDVELARQIAVRASWPWRPFPLPTDWDERLPPLAERAVAWGDGHLEALSLAEVLDAHQRKAASQTALFNGSGGENFRDYAWGHELWAAGRSRAVAYERLLAWRVLLPVDLSAMRADPTPAVAAALRAELEARAATFAAQPNTLQNDMLYMLKGTGHAGAYQAAAGESLDLELPFCLRPVLLTTISAAPHHRRFHRLMREMIRRLDPEIAAIPTETGGPAEPPRLGNLYRFAPYPWRRGRRFVARAWGRLPGVTGKVVPPTRREAAGARFVAALRAEGRLDPARMRSAALFDRRRLGELLDRAAKEPRAVDWAAVGRIVTVELALEAADAGLE